MAQRTNRQNTSRQKNTSKQNDYEHSAVLHIIGTLKEVYVGKKYAYGKIECYNNGDYYTLFRVAFPLDYDFPEDGDDIDIFARVTSYKNEYSFAACEPGDMEPF